jgi:hypothetical protein
MGINPEYTWDRTTVAWLNSVPTSSRGRSNSACAIGFIDLLARALTPQVERPRTISRALTARWQKSSGFAHESVSTCTKQKSNLAGSPLPSGPDRQASPGPQAQHTHRGAPHDPNPNHAHCQPDGIVVLYRSILLPFIDAHESLLIWSERSPTTVTRYAKPLKRIPGR